jgi:hypothetical protein
LTIVHAKRDLALNPASVSLLSQISEEMSMTRILVLAAALGLSLSAASACEFQRSAEMDRKVVASVVPSEPQSTPVIDVATEPSATTVVPEDQAE